jgi:hypothetical protein
MNDLFSDIKLENESYEEETILESPMDGNYGTTDIVVGATPKTTDPEWSDYVMSLFEDNELIDGMPLAAGLRRVSEIVLGPIVFSGPVQVFPPSNDNAHGRATVVFKVEFKSGICYSEVADCWEGNTDDAFCAYAVATASTRAEARALRKALKLRAVAAEEVTKKNTAQIVRDISKSQGASKSGGEYEGSARMSDAQANFINVKCRQLNVNAKTLFGEVLKTKGKITKKKASEAIEVLNKYQREKGDVPSSVLGYVEEWQ